MLYKTQNYKLFIYLFHFTVGSQKFQSKLASIRTYGYLTLYVPSVRIKTFKLFRCGLYT